jgi:DNA-binding transcriptional ArsR family regulator
MARKTRTEGRSGAGMPEGVLDAVAERFRALSVPSRLRILNALMGGPSSMGALSEATGLEQSNLSRHVTELERAGCVRRRRAGRTVEVEIDDPTLLQLCDLVCGSLAERASQTHAALRRSSSGRR